MTGLKEEPTWHVLDFFCDDEDSCALTVFASGERFHIIADAKKLDKKTEVSQSYHKLLQQYRGHNNEDNSDANNEEKSADHDSGIEMNDDKKKDAQEKKRPNDPETALQQWMTAPLSSTFSDLRASSKRSKPLSVQEWYHCPTHFYELSASENGETLEASELESTSDLQDRMQEFLPEMSLPKYITERTTAHTYNASSLLVLQESDQPIGTPYHPCRVRLRDKKTTHFIKVVDKSQPQAIKRELGILNTVTNERLHEKIRVPVLEGLVTFDDASDTATGRPKIMGFLISEIPEAKPLTGMLDPSIPQTKRYRWAREAERLKSTLHEHGVVWGDAKADNFMVDKDDNLWIIDFGGSYTEGWVDPEIKETVEGDDMGTEKTVNALHDPVKNTWDPEREDEERAHQSKKEEIQEGGSENEDAEQCRNRKRKAIDQEDEKSSSSKARKRS